MRLELVAMTACVLGLCGRPAAMAAPGALPMHECRLEHPLRMSSIGARCGVLRVPEDPARPSGRRIELGVAVVPALNRRAEAAPLFLLAGGPGQAASDLYVSYAAAFARINRNHDIVLVDQRGTGRSAPLACLYPDDWQETSEEMPALRQATLGLSARSSAIACAITPAASRYKISTQVRRALGYPRIDLYGSSYGTRMAELYMRRYPGSTHAAILDGVTYPEQAVGPDTPLDGERALNLILTRCLASPDCAAAYPDVRRDLDGLRRRFGPDKAALTLTDPSSGLPLAIEFNRSVLSAALRFLSYSSTEASLLPTLIHQAAAGQLAPLAAQTVMMARQLGDQLASGMQNSVDLQRGCAVFRRTSDRPSAARADLPGHGPAGRAHGDLQTVADGSGGCRHLHSALHSAVPSLLLSGEADPVTPPGDAERLARRLGRHRHLVLPGEGHGQLATGCVPKLMAEFLDAARSASARCRVSRASPSRALLRRHDRSRAVIEARLCASDSVHRRCARGLLVARRRRNHGTLGTERRRQVDHLAHALRRADAGQRQRAASTGSTFAARPPRRARISGCCRMPRVCTPI